LRLKRHATDCPACNKVRLHFATLAGVAMLKREAQDGKMVYDARCPKCGGTYEIPAPR